MGYWIAAKPSKAFFEPALSLSNFPAAKKTFEKFVLRKGMAIKLSVNGRFAEISDRQ